MAELGYTSLFLAFFAAIYSAGGFILGAKRKSPALISSARNGLLAVSGLVTIATGTLLYAIFTHNFQIEYVANYTSRDMSPTYLFSALWAGNDGSLLFWAWLISIFAAAMSTIDSSLNTSATLIMVDFYKRYFRRGAGQAECLRAIRWLTVIVGLIGTGVGLAVIGARSALDLW